MKPVFEYTNYRAFLKDLYSERKAADPSFTYDYIGSKVGFKSSGYLSQVIKGQTNVSLEMAHRFAGFFGLNKKESEYFETLVLFNQAQRHDDKKCYYERMMSFKEASVKVLGTNQYEYLSNWHNVAVREILHVYRFRGDYEELAKMVQPAITAEQAKQAVVILEKVGLVQKDAEGVYTLTTEHVSSNAYSPAIENYLLNSLDMAKKSVDAFAREEREISSVTMSVSRQGYGEIIKELQAFRNRIREIVANNSDPDRAYQFNFQVYPISKPIPRDKQ